MPPITHTHTHTQTGTHLSTITDVIFHNTCTSGPTDENLSSVQILHSPLHRGHNPPGEKKNKIKKGNKKSLTTGNKTGSEVFARYKIGIMVYTCIILYCGWVPAANVPGCTVQTLVFSRSYLHRQVPPPETLVVKGGTTWARNGRWILPENGRLPPNIQGSFTCRKSTTWDKRFYFPSEGRRAEDFFHPEKSDGFGRVWARELVYQRSARYLYTTGVHLLFIRNLNWWWKSTCYVQIQWRNSLYSECEQWQK